MLCRVYIIFHVFLKQKELCFFTISHFVMCLQVTLNGFRSGKFMTLVATNVAARGLDINDVQLIIQVCLDTLVLQKFVMCF